MSGLEDANSLIKKIYETFPTDLGEGISWKQAEVIDDYGSPDAEKEARKKDAHIPWPVLVDDPNFYYVGGGNGGFAFLDPKGFRHYLPVLLVRTVRAGKEDSDQIIHLLSCEPDLPSSQWAELTDDMRKVIAQCVHYVLETQRETGDAQEAAAWQRLLENYWDRYLDLD